MRETGSFFGALASIYFLSRSSALPWCRNSSLLILGSWSVDPQLWRINEDVASCMLADATGVAALEALRGTHLIFLGDSILRQLFHTFVHGTIRQMPVIVDPVYGFAHYTAALPDETHPYARDNFEAQSKEQGRLRGETVAAMGKSAIDGWQTENGVEALFLFQNNCEQVFHWLGQLKVLRSRHHTVGSPGGPAAGGRRVVLVTNLGASNIFASTPTEKCLRELLPAEVASVASSWEPPSRGGRHHFVMMNQPTADTVLEGRLKNEENAGGSYRANAAIEHLLSTLRATNRDQKAHPLASHLATHLLDFEGFLSRSNTDLLAPPDAVRPIAEDRLHYGCQWTSKVPGYTNSVGYTAGLLKGLHHVNRPVGDDEIQGPHLRVRHSDRSREPAPAHCALVCGSKMLRQLSSMLLSLVGSESSTVPSSTYQVAVCIPEYDEIPCPLMPMPQSHLLGTAFNATGQSPLSRPLKEVSLPPPAPMNKHDFKAFKAAQNALRRAAANTSLLGGFSREVPGSNATADARVRQVAKDARTAEEKRFSELEVTFARDMGARDVLAMFTDWQKQFEAGGLQECTVRDATSNRERFVGTEWCEAALHGPGGQLPGAFDRPTGKQKRGLLGTWCALPSTGRFLSH